MARLWPPHHPTCLSLLTATLSILSAASTISAQLSTSTTPRPSSRSSRPGESERCFCPCAVLGLVVIAISACSALFIVILVFFLVRQRKRIKELLKEQEASLSAAARSARASPSREDSNSVKEVKTPRSGEVEKISIQFPARSLKSPAPSSAKFSLPPTTPRIPSPLPPTPRMPSPLPLNRQNSLPLPLAVPPGQPTPPAKSPAMSIKSGGSVTVSDERHEETVVPGYFDEVLEDYEDEDEYETVEEFHSPQKSRTPRL